MDELTDVPTLLEMAERSAGAGDFSSAGKLLRDAARLQETELGPLHPDLASTMNNLAIIAERTGQFGDAEVYYRRAAEIASASLPADHPMVAETRNNLEGFCREHGLPLVAPARNEPAADLPSVLIEAAPDEGAVPVPAPATVAAASVPPEPASVSVVTEPSAPAALKQDAPAPGGRPPGVLYVAIAAIVLLTGAFLVTRTWLSRDAPAAAPTVPSREPEPASAPSSSTPAPAPSSAAAPAPTAPTQPPKVAVEKPPAAGPSRPARSPAGSGVSLAAAELCQRFSTDGDRWRCDPPADPAARGRLVLYTRVKSARDTVVVHRWYLGRTLRQAVKLTVRANASEGYRTYSRQNVVDPGSWRVEVANADGALLHEQRFTVR